MSAFSDAVESTILQHAGPFEAIDETGRTGLAAFLSAEVELEGITKSRQAHCADSDQVMIDFHYRLRFVGHFAADAGLARIRHAAARRQTSPLVLTREDLEEGEALTSTASGTGLCEPPNDS